MVYSLHLWPIFLLRNIKVEPTAAQRTIQPDIGTMRCCFDVWLHRIEWQISRKTYRLCSGLHGAGCRGAWANCTAWDVYVCVYQCVSVCMWDVCLCICACVGQVGLGAQTAPLQKKKIIYITLGGLLLKHTLRLTQTQSKSPPPHVYVITCQLIANSFIIIKLFH